MFGFWCISRSLWIHFGNVLRIQAIHNGLAHFGIFTHLRIFTSINISSRIQAKNREKKKKKRKAKKETIASDYRTASRVLQALHSVALIMLAKRSEAED